MRDISVIAVAVDDATYVNVFGLGVVQ